MIHKNFKQLFLINYWQWQKLIYCELVGEVYKKHNILKNQHKRSKIFLPLKSTLRKHWPRGESSRRATLNAPNNRVITRIEHFSGAYGAYIEEKNCCDARARICAVVTFCHNVTISQASHTHSVVYLV